MDAARFQLNPPIQGRLLEILITNYGISSRDNTEIVTKQYFAALHVLILRSRNAGIPDNVIANFINTDCNPLHGPQNVFDKIVGQRFYPRDSAMQRGDHVFIYQGGELRQEVIVDSSVYLLARACYQARMVAAAPPQPYAAPAPQQYAPAPQPYPAAAPRPPQQYAPAPQQYAPVPQPYPAAAPRPPQPYPAAPQPYPAVPQQYAPAPQPYPAAPQPAPPPPMQAWEGGVIPNPVGRAEVAAPQQILPARAAAREQPRAAAPRDFAEDDTMETTTRRLGDRAREQTERPRPPQPPREGDARAAPMERAERPRDTGGYRPRAIPHPQRERDPAPREREFREDPTQHRPRYEAEEGEVQQPSFRYPPSKEPDLHQRARGPRDRGTQQPEDRRPSGDLSPVRRADQLYPRAREQGARGGARDARGRSGVLGLVFKK